jgi:hypothetical protein
MKPIGWGEVGQSSIGSLDIKILERPAGGKPVPLFLDPL